MGQRHNGLGLTEPLSTDAADYYGRPYSVIYADRFAEALKQAIKDPAVKRLRTDIGSIDQFTDSTNVIEDLVLARKLRAVYK